MKYCTNCGSKQIAKSKFCGNCGNKIEEKSTKDILPENSEDSKEIKTDEFWNKLKIDEKQIEILSDYGTGPDIMDWDDDLLEFSFPNHIQKIMGCFCLTRDEIEELEKLSSDKRGVIKYPNKEIYIGELSNGFRNGFGVYFVNEVEANQIIIDDSKDEDNFIMTYNGFWVDDKRSGKGFEVNSFYITLTYKGEWENDLYNGKGIRYGTKEAKEIGNYKNGSLHGKGKMFTEDGGVGFEGNYKDDERHGYGVSFHYYTKNKHCEGKWEFDKFIEGNIYNDDGVIVFTGKYDEYKISRDLDHDDEEDENFDPKIYITNFLKTNEPTKKGIVTCPRCLGDGYVNDEDIKRLHTTLYWTPGDCLYCSSIGKVNVKNIDRETFPYTKEELQLFSKFRDNLADEIFGDDDDDDDDNELGLTTIDPELYLSTFVDNETTFLGHEDITNALNSKSKKGKNLFYVSLFSWIDENDIELSEIKYNFMYYHTTLGDKSFLLVFSFRNQIATYILGDQKNMLKEQSWSIYPWDGQNNKLQVLKEKDTHAIIILNDAYENGDPITFRIWRAKKWDFKCSMDKVEI